MGGLRRDGKKKKKGGGEGDNGMLRIWVEMVDRVMVGCARVTEGVDVSRGTY